MTATQRSGGGAHNRLSVVARLRECPTRRRMVAFLATPIATANSPGGTVTDGSARCSATCSTSSPRRACRHTASACSGSRNSSGSMPSPMPSSRCPTFPSRWRSAIAPCDAATSPSAGCSGCSAPSSWPAAPPICSASGTSGMPITVRRVWSRPSPRWPRPGRPLPSGRSSRACWRSRRRPGSVRLQTSSPPRRASGSTRNGPCAGARRACGCSSMA